MKKLVLIAASTGFLIAVSLGAFITLCEHLACAIGPVPLITKVLLWLWPTAAMLIDADANRAGYIILLISCILNGLLYGFTAFCAGSVWSLFTSKGKWV